MKNRLLRMVLYLFCSLSGAQSLFAHTMTGLPGGVYLELISTDAHVSDSLITVDPFTQALLASRLVASGRQALAAYYLVPEKPIVRENSIRLEAFPFVGILGLSLSQMQLSQKRPLYWPTPLTEVLLSLPAQGAATLSPPLSSFYLLRSTSSIVNASVVDLDFGIQLPFPVIAPFVRASAGGGSGVTRSELSLGIKISGPERFQHIKTGNWVHNNIHVSVDCFLRDSHWKSLEWHDRGIRFGIGIELPHGR